MDTSEDVFLPELGDRFGTNLRSSLVGNLRDSLESNLLDSLGGSLNAE